MRQSHEAPAGATVLYTCVWRIILHRTTIIVEVVEAAALYLL